MLKQGVVIILFMLPFVLQTFSKAFIVIDYFINADSFAKNCENKDDLQLHCNGKCQMIKQLKQEEKKDEQNPERKGENKVETVLSSKSYFTTYFPFILPISVTYVSIQENREIKMPRTVFHPPCI